MGIKKALQINLGIIRYPSVDDYIILFDTTNIGISIELTI